MSFPLDPSKPVVADASVVINLNATLRAAEIISTLSNSLLVTENARLELEAGLRNGHADAEKLRVLIHAGSVRIAHLNTVGTGIYERLIEGAAERTLDDGEAATIAYACETGGIAIVDERKARSLCATLFPHLTMMSTAELLASDTIATRLGRDGQVAAIVNALQGGRMRVPWEHVERIVALIGRENAACCTSLPKSAKRGLVTR